LLFGARDKQSPGHLAWGFRFQAEARKPERKASDTIESGCRIDDCG
jgi:hypothetical protein